MGHRADKGTGSMNTGSQGAASAQVICQHTGRMCPVCRQGSRQSVATPQIWKGLREHALRPLGERLLTSARTQSCPVDSSQGFGKTQLRKIAFKKKKKGAKLGLGPTPRAVGKPRIPHRKASWSHERSSLSAQLWTHRKSKSSYGKGGLPRGPPSELSPAKSLTLTSAPSLMSSLIRRASPRMAARCRRVSPRSFLLFTLSLVFEAELGVPF